MIGSLVSLILLLVVLGLMFWLIEQLPIAQPFKLVIRIIGVLIAIVVVLQFLGPALNFRPVDLD